MVAVATGATFDPTGLNGLRGREILGWDRDFVYSSETPGPQGRVAKATRDGFFFGWSVQDINMSQTGLADNIGQWDLTDGDRARFRE